MSTSCGVVPLRPASPTALEKAIFAACDAWFMSERARDDAYRVVRHSPLYPVYLKERDECRKECGRQLALAKKLHAEAKISVPWNEWAPAQTGWSYMTIVRRMSICASADPPAPGAA
jgi:hypothetical protein